ncbi:hypothetical protein ACLOJK_022186 [Asimina triloba]
MVLAWDGWLVGGPHDGRDARGRWSWLKCDGRRRTVAGSGVGRWRMMGGPQALAMEEGGWVARCCDLPLLAGRPEVAGLVSADEEMADGGKAGRRRAGVCGPARRRARCRRCPRSRRRSSMKKGGVGSAIATWWPSFLMAPIIRSELPRWWVASAVVGEDRDLGFAFLCNRCND